MNIITMNTIVDEYHTALVGNKHHTNTIVVVELTCASVTMHMYRGVCICIMVYMLQLSALGTSQTMNVT